MKVLVGLLGVIWALANLLAASLMIRGSFGSPTPAKEGFPAQALLLLGGLLLALFALSLIWGSLRLTAGRSAGEAV